MVACEGGSIGVVGLGWGGWEGKRKDDCGVKGKLLKEFFFLFPT